MKIISIGTREDMDPFLSIGDILKEKGHIVILEKQSLLVPCLICIVLKIIRKITRKQIKNALLSNKVIYTISPSLFSKRDYWSDNINVLGYQERIRELSWKTIKDLND